MKHYTEITTSLYYVRFYTFHNTIYCRKRRISRCLQSMFSFTTTMIWETSQAGVLILEENITESVLQTALDTLETDFLYPYPSLLDDVIRKQLNLLTCINGNEHYFLFFLPIYQKITYIEQLLLIN